MEELPILPENLVSLNIKGNAITEIKAEQLPETLTNFATDLVKSEAGNYYTEYVEDGEETSEPEKTPSEGDKKDPVEEEKDNTPKTGVSSYIAVAAVVVVASLATIIFIKKKNV